MRPLGYGIFLAIAVFVTTSPALAASFPCAAAKTLVEHTICNEPALSAQDDRAAGLYRSLRAMRPHTLDAGMLLTEQRMFLDRRNDCSTSACLASIYAQRIGELQDGIANMGGRRSLRPAFWYDCQFGHHHWFVDLAPNQERLFASGNVYDLDDVMGSMSGAPYMWSVSQTATVGKMPDIDVGSITFTVPASTSRADELRIGFMATSLSGKEIEQDTTCKLVRAIPFAG